MKNKIKCDGWKKYFSVKWRGIMRLKKSSPQHFDWNEKEKQKKK